MEEKVLIVKYGEIAMRGNNRKLFITRLVDAIRKNIDEYGQFYVVREQGRLIVEARGETEIDFDLLIPKVNKIFGILGTAPGLKVSDQSIENLSRVALEHMKKYFGDKEYTFKVLTKRSNKQYPMESNEVSAAIGEVIFENMDNLTVDVHNPEVVLTVELRNDAYIYSKINTCFRRTSLRFIGQGGCPSFGRYRQPCCRMDDGKTWS